MPLIDARLPVRFAPLNDRRPDEAVLTDAPGGLAPPAATFSIRTGPIEAGHPPDCACCTPRTGAALALAALFRERATTPGPPFRGVLAVVGPAGEAAIRAALAADPFASGRYRIA